MTTVPAPDDKWENYDEKLVLSFLNSLYDEAERAKSERRVIWEKNLDMVEGRHWEAWGVERPSGLAQVTFNSLWRIIRQEAALLTDARPTVKVVARNSKLFDAAVTLNKLVQAVFQDEHIDLTIVRVVFDLATFGVAFVKTWWDKTALGGIGKIRISRIDPRAMFIDDTFMASEALFICQVADVPLIDLRRNFPGRADLVRPSSRRGEIPERYIRTKIRGTRGTLTVPSAVAVAPVREWWVRDPTLEGDEYKYPNGRLITDAFSVVLSDIKSPYILPWPGPWTKFSVPTTQDTAWPPTPVEQVTDLQQYLNLTISNVLDQVRFVSQGIWIGDSGVLSPTEKKKLMSPIPPSTFIEKTRGLELRWERLADVSPTAMGLINLMQQAIEFIYGMMDVSYGRVPRGVVAGAALEQLQLASQSIIRLSAREIERGLSDIGQKVLGLILQFYDEDRVESLIGPGGELEVVRFERQELLSDYKDAPADELFYQFKFVVRPDSSLSISREKEYAAATALYAAGLLDRQAALELIDIPNKEALFERLKAQDTLKAMSMAAGGTGTEEIDTARGGPTPRGRGVEVIKKMMR